MKTAFPIGNAYFKIGATISKTILLLCTIFFSDISKAQTTIVNYNFDVSSLSEYSKFYSRAVNGTSCLLSSSDVYNQNLHAGSGSFAGTVTGAGAFFANTAASPNRILALTNTGAKYFNFRISGSSIAAYNTFKVYFQARRIGAGTTTINSVQYSVDGGAFSNLGTTLATSTTWAEFSFSLPVIAPTSTLDLRINFTNSSSSGVFGVDNFQVQGVAPASASVCIASNHPLATNVYASTVSNIIAAYRMDAHASTITPASFTFTTGGGYLVTDFVNFKLWQNSYNTLNGATQAGSTILAPTSGTNITFNTGFTGIAANTSSYFFITADVLVTAVAGRTVNITSTAFTNFSFTGGPAKIGISPVTAGSTFTVAASLNKYTQTSGSGNWDNGSAVNRWGTASGGPYTGRWSQNGIANLETSGEIIQTDATTGAIASRINVTADNFNLQSTQSPTTTGIVLTNYTTIDVSSTYRLTVSNSNSANSNSVPLYSRNGLVKQGTGELMFAHGLSYITSNYSKGLEGPLYINGGTLTIGNKTTNISPILFLNENDIFINNGTFTIAAPGSTESSLGLIRSINVDGTGGNNAQIELYRTTTNGNIYSEITTDDRYPQLAIDLVPINIQGKLTLGYGGLLNGVTSALVLGSVNLTANASFKVLTNGAGNFSGSSGIITNLELAGEGGRSGLSATPAIGNFGVTDNGHTLLFQGNGTASADGGYISINGSAGSSTGDWTVGNADGSQAAYLSINDVDGMTSGSITVNQNSQLDINVSGTTVTIAKTPAITLNGAKAFSYYGAMALYNSTVGTTANTINTPVVVNTTDATVALYNNAWTLGGAITGTGVFQLWANTSTHNLTLTSASNTWTGGTKILSGILNVNSGSAISTGALTMAQLTGFDTRLNLNNAAQTVGPLSSAWVNTTGTRSQIINLASGHKLTVNQSTNTIYGDGAVNTLTAIISGAGNLIKDGTGTLTLTGANTYTGLTQVKAGILQLNRTNTGTALPITNNVHILGGTLQVSRDQTLNDVTLSTGSLQIESGITLTINGIFTLVNGTINLVGTGKIVYGTSARLTYAGSAAQTTSVKEIPAASGPRSITNDNNTTGGVILNANVANLIGSSVNNGWLDFNGKTLTGAAGTFTSNGVTGPFTFTGTTSAASNVITSVSSTAGLGMGMRLVSGSLPANTFIIYIDPLVPNTITLSNNASSNTVSASVTASWRGGLIVSMPNGIGDGTVNSHVQTTGTNVYNSGANYIFKTPTSGTRIYPAFPTSGTLNYSPAYNVTIQAGVSNKVIMANGHDLEVSNDLTLTSAIFVTNNNLITWANSGGVLTSPNAPYSTLSTASNNSYIATVSNTGTELTVAFPYTGAVGFRIKNVGSSTDIYFPIGVNFTSSNRMMLNNSGTVSDFTVLLKTGDLQLTAGARVNRIWYVKSSGTSGIKANMRLFFTKKDWTGWPVTEEEVESGFLYNDIHLIQKNYSGAFVNKSVGTDVSTASFTSATYNNTEIFGKYTFGVSPDPAGATNGINDFTRFSLVNNLIILPVTVTNIKAYQQGNAVKIDWTAVNEINIGQYEVERSIDAVNFKNIGNITGLNNGNLQNTYTLLDIEAIQGNNFYRIKITDKDGTVTYTSTVSVNINGGKVSVNIQPNPVVNRTTNIQLNSLAAGKYNLLLYNSIGQMIYTKIIEHTGGSSVQQLLLPATVMPGTYTLRLYNETSSFNIRLAVQ